MDFEAIIDRECPAPIHWLTHRRYVIGRVKYEVEKREARIAALEAAVTVMATVIVESRKQREYERINNLCPGGCVADSLEQAAVKVLANPIAAAAVREAGK